MTTSSKINLIDLAGSERASQVLNDQVIKTAEVAALRLKVRNKFIVCFDLCIVVVVRVVMCKC